MSWHGRAAALLPAGSLPTAPPPQTPLSHQPSSPKTIHQIISHTSKLISLGKGGRVRDTGRSQPSKQSSIRLSCLAWSGLVCHLPVLVTQTIPLPSPSQSFSSCGCANEIILAIEEGPGRPATLTPCIEQQSTTSLHSCANSSTHASSSRLLIHPSHHSLTDSGPGPFLRGWSLN